ncbi:MAG: CotH kinase family protein, partial [Lachnoclostridium sp.]|nr:CotH kinase family protein [Lachnoclostridium sp.]
TVNGEDYGFGIMLERYDEAFLDRVYGTSGGELYSVKIGMGQREDFGEMWKNVENNMPQRRQRTTALDSEKNDAESGIGENFNESDTGEGPPGGGFGGMSMGNMGGGSLVYTDDSPDSYGSIFPNSVKNPDKITDKDKQRVITALENLNAGTELEKYFDVDAILRYFAAHTVMVNNDSYTSNMAQNYYLYERNGQLTILPWDYNLSFGSMGDMGGTLDASSIVNFPIDTPVSGVSMEERPLLNKLLEVPEYMERYHEYLRDITEGYFDSGLYEETIRTWDSKINDFVKNDAAANYTYEQYELSLPEFIKLLRLRSLSIKGQLEGIIPTTSSGQNTDSSMLIDASQINLSALGSMGGGDRQGGQFGGQYGGQFGEQGKMPTMPDGQQPGGFGNMDIPSSSEAVPTVSNSSYIIITAVLLIILASAVLFIAKPRRNKI